MDDTTKKPPVPEEEGLLNKAKNLLNKADDLLDESVEKAKKSKAFAKATDALNKAEDYVEDKIEEFEKSGMKEKLESMADKAEEKAGGALKKLRDLGKSLANKAEVKFDEMAANIKGKPKQTNQQKKS
jgi:ElaB/YqjD/DUF883 family membrane-anchored ribosome-binding protein